MSREKIFTGNAELLVGTCGYSYREWIDAGFYPAGTKTGEMLGYYAEKFPVTELNYTWYQMPREEAISRMLYNVPDNFSFAAKVTRILTHEVNSKTWKQDALNFKQGISPLTRAGRLLTALVQLPPDFSYTQNNRTYLARLLDALSPLPLAVEFRHDSWAKDSVFAELERRQVSLVAVDEPKLANLFPPLDIVTNQKLFYVRFHGRNQKGWYAGNMQQKFDYDYSEEELMEWVNNQIKSMSLKAARGVLFFNNHVAGQAPVNAHSLVRLLKAQSG
jgi:uncharacterized protein YecE (DUF72 family)